MGMGLGLCLEVDGGEGQTNKQRCHAGYMPRGQEPGPGSVVERVKNDREHHGMTSSEGLLWVYC